MDDDTLAMRIVFTATALHALLSRPDCNVLTNNVPALARQYADDCIHELDTTPISGGGDGFNGEVERANPPRQKGVNYYRVQPGDTFVNIGRTFKIPHDEMCQANRDRVNPSTLSIWVGQDIVLPR